MAACTCHCVREAALGPSGLLHLQAVASSPGFWLPPGSVGPPSARCSRQSIFSVTARFGGGALVPGSAHDVPTWLIAGPVVKRLEVLAARRRRTFVSQRETRSAPRGRVDWVTWSTRHAPIGRWMALPCESSDLQDDPNLMAAMRWTLARVSDDLRPHASSTAGRNLLDRVRRLQQDIGDGPRRRPTAELSGGRERFVIDGIEAMQWIANKRGLGGPGGLDGLPWDLEVADVWEAWVRSFVDSLRRNSDFTFLALRIAGGCAGTEKLRRWVRLPLTSCCSGVNGFFGSTPSTRRTCRS